MGVSVQVKRRHDALVGLHACTVSFMLVRTPTTHYAHFLQMGNIDDSVLYTGRWHW